MGNELFVVTDDSAVIANFGLPVRVVALGKKIPAFAGMTGWRE